jgi:hypothetical protein
MNLWPMNGAHIKASCGNLAIAGSRRRAGSGAMPTSELANCMRMTRQTVWTRDFVLHVRTKGIVPAVDDAATAQGRQRSKKLPLASIDRAGIETP